MPEPRVPSRDLLDTQRPTSGADPGGTVARAKRTDRAEARRRHRAAVAESLPDEDLGADDSVDETSPARPVPTARSTPAASGAAVPRRPSIVGAFRESFRPVDIRGDFRALPQLVRHRSFLLPLILSSLSVALIPFLGLTPLTYTFWQYFAGAGPIGAAFLAGFFAPRASWLIGGLIAVIVAALQWVAFQGQFGGYFDAIVETADPPLTGAEARSLVFTQILVYGIPTAAFFAAAAAWYKRFLNRASPNRGARRPQSGGARRPDGKVPKKQQQRPMLARRR
jgi:hypothetical protein